MSDLKGFKIQDAQKRRVDRPGQAGDGDQDHGDLTEPESVGFPNIEAQVDSDGPAVEAMRARFEELTELANGAGGAKDKANAKKAALGYERALALLDHLLQTKSQLSAPASEE